MAVLTGKVAIVTGAGQGVGAGIARAFAREGAKVALLGRTVGKCEAVAADIAGFGGEAIAVACDVQHRDQIEASVAQVVDTWGRLDALVNNAQATTYASIRKLTDDDLHAMWEVGPLACFRFMQVCFPHLRETGGNVINLGSGSGILPQPAMAGYAMTKEALRTLSRVAAVEWGRFGVRVNVLCPLADSPGAQGFDDSTGAYEAVRAQVPLGKWGDAEADIGRAAVFLAGPDAGYVTGTTLMVDGGFTYLR